VTREFRGIEDLECLVFQALGSRPGTAPHTVDSDEVVLLTQIRASLQKART
jgi:hypothetical protein